MAKVYPRRQLSSTSSNLTSKQEVFTIWMKSLVLNGKGCTVFDSSGQIVYRVDNYHCRNCDEVYLMDIKGKVLFTILRKKFSLFGCWKGYRSTGKGHNKGNLGFQVRKKFSIWKWKSWCEVKVGLDENQPCRYKIIESWKSKSGLACKIVDRFGGLIAVVTRKLSTQGVDLGDDVQTMVVESRVDHSLIMGFVISYSLLNSKM